METPKNWVDKFIGHVKNLVEQFGTSKLMTALESREVSIETYHRVLLAIFHQTYMGPATFALAAAMIDHSKPNLKGYLMKHADEEKDHWKWVLSDLESTGFKGKDPRKSLPDTPTMAYVAFNYFVALKHPASRIAIAAVLEGIGGTFGRTIATKACDVLKLKPQQIMFASGHSETDSKHADEIFEVIRSDSFTAQEVDEMFDIATKGKTLYCGIFDACFVLGKERKSA